METIKGYLEAMFASMPNTPEVKKAKDELLQMMEDKYNEMIEDGVNENTAVGTVISEFGNLDELAEDLGLTKEVEEVHERQQDVKSRFVNMDEVKGYLATESKCARLIALGVFLCITSVIYPMLWDFFGNSNEEFGAVGMFLSIGIAVALFVYSGITAGEWNFLKKERCQIDIATADYVKEQRRAFKTTRALCLTIGVMFCVISFVPCIIADTYIMSVMLFLFVGVGVFLIVFSSIIYGSFEKILKINDRSTISGNYGKDGDVEFVSKTAEVFMELYWPTVTCIYLGISFLTYRWDITWVIWPVAAIAQKILYITLAKEEE